ncbi:MAG TPA: peptidoglycan DD-metalloendopeptidase family protein [Anaerolineales bacterium]|nr:peptidoglycan DD-metalloendopeptidase family protein [Anaerolineales bacterium]
MRRLILPIVLLLGLGAGLGGNRPGAARFFDHPDPPIPREGYVEEIDPETRAALEAALQAAAARSRETGLAFIVFDVKIDHLRITAGGDWAVVWIAAVDRATREVAAMEPWIGIGVQEQDAWRISLPSDPDFLDLLDRSPEAMFTEQERLILGDGRGATCDTSAIGPFTGYKLPWEGGKTIWLTQSIYHTLGWGNNPTFSMIYAFDFASSPSGLFDIWASRPGTVKYFWDEQPNNDPTSPGNYIVLEDTGTNPTSYQLYLHLAQGSIPAALKTVGTPVQQGQFIGVADDTGYSTGHHLHYQVHTEVSWWGCSVDLRFVDVPINGGRPRLPIEAENYPEYGALGQTTYVSGNTAPPSNINPPGGGLLDLPHGLTFSEGEIDLHGYAFDYQTGVETAWFAARTDGAWFPVSGPFSFSPSAGTVYFSGTVALCAAGVPDGPVTLGIIAEDGDGSVGQGGLAVPAILDAGCAPPPPACTPAADQAAVYEFENYAGACRLFGVGDHVENFTARSLRVGGDVSVTLYFSPQLRARSQTFFADDRNLSDDRTGLDQHASVRVLPRAQPPGVPTPAWPAGGESIPLESSFSLVWHDGGGSREFEARVTGPSGSLTSAWSTAPFWDPGQLSPGDYSWEVRARNDSGESGWSAPGFFSIAAAQQTGIPPGLTAPIAEDFENGENGWFGTGLWNRLNDPGVAFNGLFSWWYGTPAGDYDGGDYRTGSPNAGSLTSPPIFIPAHGYFLRFHSILETEGRDPHWDRRRVLISADGGPFAEIYRPAENQTGGWVRSPFFDLSAYSGESIRIRFVFETMDAQFNDFQGWVLDQITIDQDGPPVCQAAGEPNGTPEAATPLPMGVPFEGEICPVGDIDFYSFTGDAGDRIRLDVDAQSTGSQLDAHAFLLAGDGASVIAESDDEVPGALFDPLIEYTLPETGVYYVKIRSGNHPEEGGPAYPYTLSLEADAVDPMITGLSTSVPLDDPWDLPQLVTLTASAFDSDSGLASIEFFYHSYNWGQDLWISLGVDQDGSNGWSAVWDTNALPPHPGTALLAVATDRAGNVAAFGLWDLFPIPDVLYLPVTIR